MPTVVVHVLGPGPMLPRAIAAPWAAQPGSFDDPTQQQLAQALQQATRGAADVPLVFYCASPQCWMSYNAATRAVRLGYRNVLWYRGGLAAWQQAGLPTGQGSDAAQPYAASAQPARGFGAGVRP
ncbi:MAG: hypothetical protein HS128_21415 [Ideonella sp.]|nr:hypothetical protein [Ideonella sp.]